MIRGILEKIGDPITTEEYGKRTEDFRNNLNRLIELLTRYNINPCFVEYEVKRCIGISGFPGEVRLLMDLRNPVLDSGIDKTAQEKLIQEYHNFFGETVYAEELQLPLGQERPRDAVIKGASAIASVVYDPVITDTPQIWPPQTTQVYTPPTEPTPPTPATQPTPINQPITLEEKANERQRVIQFESGNRLILTNVTSFDKTKNYLRFICDQGFVLVNPRKVEHHIIQLG